MAIRTSRSAGYQDHSAGKSCSERSTSPQSKDMDSLRRNFVLLCLASSCLKLLLSLSYRSTDFEVHRNWLAVTSSLHLSEWYVTNVSEWTLDYPPLFAWFERFLAFFASFWDEKMLILDNLNYASSLTVLFQRISVIITDAVYFLGVYKALCWLVKKGFIRGSSVVLSLYAALFVFNFGLFIVDHIHFQYNGILKGIWILSIVAILEEQWVAGALWFSVLLNMKHMYLYVAPSYFIFILRACLIRTKGGRIRVEFLRFVSVATTVILIFAVSFGPFIYEGVIKNVISRLFPFKRGLCHAYWAPNVWAIYNVVDKALYYSLRSSGVVKSNGSVTASMTGGMVKEYDHMILPTIRPIYTIIVSLLFMLPILWKLFVTRQSKSKGFIEAMILCGWTSYLFGWHVHEKAIMMVIIPMILLLPMSKTHNSIFLVISTVGHYSLLPLIFTAEETIFKVTFLLLFVVMVQFVCGQLRSGSGKDFCSYGAFKLFPRKLYLLSFIPLFIFTDCLPDFLGFHAKFPFLPLLLTSVHCSVGIIYSYIICYVNFLL